MMESKIDPLFLTGQMAALKQYIEEKIGDRATVCLCDDGSIYVEAYSGRSIAFNTINKMLETIEEFKHRD